MKKEDRFVQLLAAGMFIILGIATLSSLGLFDIFKAEGASLAQQLNANELDGDPVILTQTFTPASSGFVKFVFTKIQLDAGLTGTSTIYLYDDSDPSDGFSSLLEVATTSYTNSGPLNQAFTTTSTLSGSTYLQSGRTYTLRAEINSITTDPPRRFSGTTTDDYGGGRAWFTTLNVVDYYFDITDSGGSSVIDSESTGPQLLFPTDNIITADFDNWVGRVTSSTTSGTFFVRYSQSTSTWAYSDPVTYASSTGSDSFYIPKRRSLYDYNSTSSQTWYAQAAFQNAEGTSFGPSISFTVNAPNDSDNAPPGSFTFEGPDCDSSTTAASSTLQEIGCELRAAGFALMKFFVVPGQSSTAFLISSYEDFQEVFPFSIFFSLTDLAYQETSSTSTSGSIVIPWPSEIGGGSVTIFGTSTALKTITSNAFASTLFNAILLIALFAFGYTIFKIIF